ncbi:MAG: carbohydrate ABC transporter permease, partial [Ruminococcaceae bacterium]|nr:carbohydrate ABC transporter permease [Oscillospiraceae bacterium]
MKIKKTIGERLFDLFNILFMLFMIVICAYPLLYVVFGSFSSANELIKMDGILWRPAGFSLEGYKVVFANEDLLSGYLNSIYYIVMGTSLGILFKCFMAFNLSRPYLKHNGWIMKFMMVTMFFGGGLIPTFLVVKSLGLYGSRWAIILGGLMSIYNLIVLKTSFMAVPHSLEESARIDGAGSMTVLFRIVIPLSMAAIAVQILFASVGIWNSWFPAMIYLKDRRPIPV